MSLGLPGFSCGSQRRSSPPPPRFLLACAGCSPPSVLDGIPLSGLPRPPAGVSSAAFGLAPHGSAVSSRFPPTSRSPHHRAMGRVSFLFWSRPSLVAPPGAVRPAAREELPQEIPVARPPARVGGTRADGQIRLSNASPCECLHLYPASAATSPEMRAREKATHPDDLGRLFMERAGRGDADGVAALYEKNAVLALVGRKVVGRESIRKEYEEFLGGKPKRFQGELQPSVTRGIWRLPRRGSLEGPRPK